MLSSRIEALKSAIPNYDERGLLEGVYLFNGAIKYLRENAEYDSKTPITNEDKVVQIRNMIFSIDELLAESAGAKDYKTKHDSVEGIAMIRPGLQKMIVDYVVANNYSNKAFREVAKAAESLSKSGGVERARTANKKEYDKLRSEYFVLDLRFSKMVKK